MENDYIIKIADNESLSFNNHLLLSEVEHNSENYQGRSLYYLPKPKAKAESTNQGLDNSWYHAKTKSDNWLIVHTAGYLKKIIRAKKKNCLRTVEQTSLLQLLTNLGRGLTGEFMDPRSLRYCLKTTLL